MATTGTRGMPAVRGAGGRGCGCAGLLTWGLIAAIATWVPGSAGARDAGAQEPSPRAALPRSRLAVRAGTAWRTWWRSDAAPTRWTGAHALPAAAVRWRRAGPGIEWGTLPLAGRGEAWRLRVVLVRVDPVQHELRLVEGPDASLLEGRWTVDSAPVTARVALNAGLFRYGTPWGWVVLGGAEVLPPRRGPLAMTVAQDSAGRVHWIEDADVERARATLRPRVAFQSYPALLVGDGAVPAPLGTAGRGLDVGHRDARLALGELRDGRLLIALTRFDALGDALDQVPFGPTVPEMAAIMGAMGCRRAVLLDGGTSAQLLLRDAGGEAHRWRGFRGVPLGLVVVPR
ncbi:MAG: phosphodiester glycosidase family protein [Gemmatimonadaceae bacterium]